QIQTTTLDVECLDAAGYIYTQSAVNYGVVL
ncbi:MAG: hypothetical protein FD130_2560, partial [Halothiobacillaceae bacterium]